MLITQLSYFLYRDWGNHGHYFKYVEMLNLLVEKTYYRIGSDIAHIHIFTIFFNCRMLLHHYPANMREENTTINIMRIRGCIRVSMMRSVDANPFSQMKLQIRKYSGEFFKITRTILDNLELYYI